MRHDTNVANLRRYLHPFLYQWNALRKRSASRNRLLCFLVKRAPLDRPVSFFRCHRFLSRFRDAYMLLYVATYRTEAAYDRLRFVLRPAFCE